MDLFLFLCLVVEDWVDELILVEFDWVDWVCCYLILFLVVVVFGGFFVGWLYGGCIVDVVLVVVIEKFNESFECYIDSLMGKD